MKNLTSNTTHQNAAKEIIAIAEPEDERVWVPQSDNVWFRPLMLDTRSGSFTDLLRGRRAGMLSRHHHPAPVHGYVIKGSWRYLEHTWTATVGSYVYEPPGETHTLIIDSDDEMITFFNNAGPVIYIDEVGKQVGYDDVFTKIDLCRSWYEKSGLGTEYIDQFIR